MRVKGVFGCSVTILQSRVSSEDDILLNCERSDSAVK